MKEEIKNEIKEETFNQEEPKPVVENCFAKEENSTDDDDEERLVIKDEPLSQDEAEEQNVSAASSCDYNLGQFKKDESQFEVSEEEMEQDVSQDEQDEDFKVEPKEEEESDEDVPLVRTILRCLSFFDRTTMVAWFEIHFCFHCFWTAPQNAHNYSAPELNC